MCRQKLSNKNTYKEDEYNHIKSMTKYKLTVQETNRFAMAQLVLRLEKNLEDVFVYFL